MIKFLASTIGIMILVIVAVVYLVNIGARISCMKTLEAMNITGKYTFWTDCLVQNKEGKLEPFNTYNTINVK